MIRTLRAIGLATLAALMVPACGGPGDEEDELTGIVVDPPETLDFGTVYECTEHHEEVLITNYGPDDEDVTVEIDQLTAQGFVVPNFSAQTTLEAGDDEALAIGIGPPEGSAEVKDATLFIYTPGRSINIRVTAEVIEGDECS